MNKFYIDAGTTYSKIIEIFESFPEGEKYSLSPFLVNKTQNKAYYIVPSKRLRLLGIEFDKSCGHMGGESHENEIIALAQGSRLIIKEPTAVVLDLGSRDAKWIRFVEGKFQDMDWNTSCASSTGATVEMLLKFYEISADDLAFEKEKFPVTCGIFGLEKIMDDISKGSDPCVSVSKFIHGIAYNAWSFAKKPETLYLSGGFCENSCFLESLRTYCNVVPLGRFVLCEGLADEE